MDYKMKYYKYKTKYLNMRQQLQLQQQIGGKIFQKKQILYIVATISQPKLKKVTKEITNTILGENIKPYRAAHITLFNLIINAENDDNIIFQDEKFYNQINNIYKETIADKNDPLILNAKSFPRDFSFSGYRPRHFIKNYESLDPQKILDFRQKIFDLIESMLGTPNINIYYNNGSKYYIYSYNGKELFAESNYYKNWKPHINFLNEFDIQKHNPDLYVKLNKYYFNNDKVNVLVDEINHIPQDIYNNINMATQMKNITYAIDHLIQKKFK